MKYTVVIYGLMGWQRVSASIDVETETSRAAIRQVTEIDEKALKWHVLTGDDKGCYGYRDGVVVTGYEIA